MVAVVSCKRAAHRKKKSIPNNEGKTYHKWKPSTTLMLLRECRDKEVWACPFGNKVRMWQDICTILKSIPNWEEDFQNLRSDKCREEYERNEKLYRADSAGCPWRSGSSEEYTEWHTLMEDMTSLADGVDVHTELFDVFDGQEMSTPQDSQTLDKDLKAAGELLRDHNLTKFTNNINCNFKDDGVSPTHRTPKKPKLSPQDMLALAITSKLEADAESARAEAAATAARVVHEQQAAEAAAHKTVREYSIAMFRNIEEIVQLIGVTCPETQQQYCTALTTNGFETPDLLMGLDLTCLKEMGFKQGHAIKMWKIVQQFVEFV